MFAINGSYPHPEFSTTDKDARFSISTVTNHTNIVCTTTGSNATFASAFLTHPVLPGQKVYIEFNCQNFQATMNIGFASPTFSPANGLGSTGDSCGYYCGDGVTANSAFWNYNNLFPAGGQNMQTAGSAHVWGMALDGIHGTAWMRVDGGIWNNNAGTNPATNIGGFSSAATVFLTPIRIGICSKTSPESITLNPGASYAPPAGFHTYGTLNVG